MSWQQVLSSIGAEFTRLLLIEVPFRTRWCWWYVGQSIFEAQCSQQLCSVFTVHRLYFHLKEKPNIFKDGASTLFPPTSKLCLSWKVLCSINQRIWCRILSLFWCVEEFRFWFQRKFVSVLEGDEVYLALLVQPAIAGSVGLRSVGRWTRYFSSLVGWHITNQFWHSHKGIGLPLRFNESQFFTFPLLKPAGPHCNYNIRHQHSHHYKPVRVSFSQQPCHAFHQCQGPPCRQVEAHTDGRQVCARATSWSRNVFSIKQWVLCFTQFITTRVQAVLGVDVKPCVFVDYSLPMTVGKRGLVV